MKDEDGIQVKAGDWIAFSFGFPPLRVEAKIVERDGKLIALTPDVTPKEAPLTTLKHHVGLFWKIDGPTVK